MFSVLLIIIIFASIVENNNTDLENDVLLSNSHISDSLLASSKH